MKPSQLPIKSLVLCPLALEKKYLLEALKSELSQEIQLSAVQTLSVGHLQAHYFEHLQLLVAQGGHGKVQFALQTQFFLQHLPQIQNVICAGTSGALLASVHHLDVVVATETIEHDYQMKFIKRDLPAIKADEKLLQTLRQQQPKSEIYKVHFGPVASGDEDIMDATRAAEVQSKTKALAVAWEGAGGAKACKFLQKSYLEVRGISDSANPEAIVNFEKNLQMVMTHVAQVILPIIK